jgi:hypothetical protein
VRTQLRRERRTSRARSTPPQPLAEPYRAVVGLIASENKVLPALARFEASPATYDLKTVHPNWVECARGGIGRRATLPSGHSVTARKVVDYGP